MSNEQHRAATPATGGIPEKMRDMQLEKMTVIRSSEL